MNRTLIGLNLAIFVNMVGTGMVMPLLLGKVVAFTGSDASVGYIASSLAVSYMLIQLPMGRLADRLGFKKFIVAGYLFCAVCGLLYYFSRGVSWIFIGRAIQGIGEAPLWALAPALLSLHYPASKGRVMGQYNATLHVGVTMGPLLGIVALNLSQHIAGDAPFLFYSCACVASALVVAVLVRDVRGKDTSSSEPGEAMDFGKIRSLASDPAIRASLVGIALYGAGYGLFLTAIPAFLLRESAWSQTLVQIFFACYYLAISVSQLIAGPLSDRWGRERFMVAGLLVSALLLAVFPFFSNRFAALGALTTAGLGLGFFYLASMAYLNAAVPEGLKGAISGAYFLFWGIGYFAGPPLVGYANAGPSPIAGFLGYAAFLLLESALLAFVLSRKKIS